MHFLKSPWEPWQQGKGWGHVTRLKGFFFFFFFFYTDGRRSLHDFARAKNITFINSPMAEVSHDFTWHAKCNSEKMHNFESCHTPPDGGGWTGTPLLSIVLEQVCTPRPDLLDTPLENCDNVLFVDGSASKDPQTGLNKVGSRWPLNWSRKVWQIAIKLFGSGSRIGLLWQRSVILWQTSVWQITQTRVMLLGSRIDFGALWKHGNFFLKSEGHPILNASHVSKLWRPFFYQTRSRSVNAQRTLTIKVLSPQETREQTRQRRPRQHRRQKKQLVLWYLWLTLIFPLVYRVCSLFPQERKNNDGGRLAAVSGGCMDECWWHSLFAQTLLSALC